MSEQEVINDRKLNAGRASAGAESFTCETLVPSEIISLILHDLPIVTLLTSAQLVCRRWRDVVEHLPTSFLADGHDDGQPPPQAGRDMNPMLEWDFGQMFNDGLEEISLWLALPMKDRAEWQNARYNLQAMTVGWTSGKPYSRPWHDRLVRRGASWRRMQICWPPVYELRYTNTVDDGGQRAEETVRFERGMRMGAFYDLVIAIVTQPRPDACDAAVVLWPVMAQKMMRWKTTARGISMATEEDMEVDAPADRDYVRVQKRILAVDVPRCRIKARPCCRCPVCLPLYPLDMRAKHIASIAWTFQCEEGDLEDLVVKL